MVRIGLPGGALAAVGWPANSTASSSSFLDLPALYDARSSTAGADAAEALRYIALSRAVAEFAATVRPQVLVRTTGTRRSRSARSESATTSVRRAVVGAVQVVHNSAFVGRFPAQAFAATGLPDSLFHPDAIEFWGDISVLKAGLVFADRIVAVSPTYAQELQTPAFGEGLEGLYGSRARPPARHRQRDRHDPSTIPPPMRRCPRATAPSIRSRRAAVARRCSTRRD